MVTLDIDTAFAPDRRRLVMANRSARISRDAASVSSRNSATLASRCRQPIAQVVRGLITPFQKVVRKIQRSHPVEIIIPRSRWLRKHHLPRHRIAPDIYFRPLEPALSGQAERLTASSRKQLRFRHRALLSE